MTDRRWTVQAWRFVPEGGSRAVGRPRKRWVDELNDFAECRREPLERKRLKFMLRHVGESTNTGDIRYDSMTWRSWWKQHEETFAIAA